MLPGLALLLALLLSALGFALWIDRFARALPPPEKAAAVVVLGAKVAPDGSPSPALERRVEAAAALFQQRLAPLVIFTGGAFGAQPSEARVAQRLALELGVPAAACLLEEESHTTAENARFTAPLLRARGIQQVLLVSDGYHLARARMLFRREGIAVLPVASARALTPKQRAGAALREVISFARSALG